MTVQTTTSTQSFLGDGVTQAFPFSFKFENEAHIFARYVLAGPSYAPLAPQVDYSVIPSRGDLGGSVITTVPVPLGTTLQIYRIVPLTQLLDYVANDQFPAEASETALDLIVEGLQQINDEVTGATGGTVGGVTSIINEGTGIGLFDTIVGTTAFLLSLEAGANITLTDTGQTVRIDAAGGGTTVGALLAANNLSDVASLQQSIDNITQATSAPNEYVWTKDTASGQGKWKVVPTGGAGEANTMSSLGGTASIVGTKTGVNLPVRGFTGGANVTVTQRATDILIDASASGEANVGQNVGVAGQGWYAGKTGLTLQFKGHAPGLGIKVAGSTTDLTTSIDTTAALTWTNKELFQGVTAAPTYPLDPGMPSIDAGYSLKVSRTAPAGSGGAGTVQAAHYVHVTTPAGSQSFEWAQVVLLENQANAGQNVGHYTKAYHMGSGATWGHVVEVQSRNVTSDAQTTFGVEIDLTTFGIASGGKHGLSLFYGEQGSNVTNPTGPTTNWPVGIEIWPFVMGRNQMTTGFQIGGTMTSAAISLAALVNTPIAMQIAGGCALRFFSGNAGNSGSVATWFPGAFVPAYSGALRIYVDSTVLYIPICSNHP